MSATTPTATRPSSRFYAAFHRYLTTTTTRSCHPIHTRLPHPPHLTPPSTFPLITRHHASTSTSTSSAPTPPTTHYTLFPLTLPYGPPPASPFTPDLRALRREYLALQSRAHPDKHPDHLKPRAEATSAAISEAYRTLTCPLRRSVYLLGLRGVDLGEGMEAPQEGEDEEFLEEVMEVRGEIDGAKEEGELEGVRRGNEGRVEGCVKGLERGFAELEGGGGGDVEGVVKGLVRETVRLRYWMGVRESLDGWEKGRGGGALQH